MYTVHYSKIIIKISAIYHEMYRKTRYYMKYFVFYFVFPANFTLCREKSIISGTVYAVPKIIWISARKPSLSEQMQRYMSGFCAWYACVQIKKSHIRTVASAPEVTGSVFMQRFGLFWDSVQCTLFPILSGLSLFSYLTMGAVIVFLSALPSIWMPKAYQ